MVKCHPCYIEMENANECSWALDKVLKLVSYYKKSYVIIVKTKVKTYNSRTKFLLIDSLTNTLRHFLTKPETK